jgi:hypothetical protein
VLRIWWPKCISNKDLWKAMGQADINLDIRKRKFRWIGHTLKKRMGKYQRPLYYGIHREVGSEEDQRTVGEDRLEAGMN